MVLIRETNSKQKNNCVVN